MKPRTGLYEGPDSSNQQTVLIVSMFSTRKGDPRRKGDARLTRRQVSFTAMKTLRHYKLSKASVVQGALRAGI